jgi:rubrerythrin
MNATKNHPSNRLVNAYNQMMVSIREAFEETDTSDTSLQLALNAAKEQVVRLGEVTLDEAHEISEYIKRDINEAAEYMMESSAEFSDWLMLDIEVIERKVVDMFLSVADRTRVELEELKHHTQELSLYYSGEITGPGTLVCTECGYQMPFVTTAQIDPCPECGNNTFRRADIKGATE